MNGVLVVISGLPGSGKSTIADAMGRSLGAPVLSVDPIEAAIWRSGIAPSFETGVAAYEIVAVLAEQQLGLGLTAIADAVSSLEVAREMWRKAARRAKSPMRVIEVICTDADVHRNRLAGRRRFIDGFPEPSWQDVLARQRQWEPWTEERLTLDSTQPLEHNIGTALQYLTD